MKKLSVLMMTVMMSIISLAQDFENKMLDNIQKIEQVKEQGEFLKLAANFGNLGSQNTKRFEAKYYEALCLVFNSFIEADNKQKDIQLDNANKIIDKAIELEPKNAELYILKAFLYQMKITVDPRNRGGEYSVKAEKQLEIALKLDDKNPRYYFLEGQNIFYTPKQYGGGKTKAKPYFEKAQKLFKKVKPENKLAPVWGQGTNASQLKACQ